MNSSTTYDFSRETEALTSYLEGKAIQSLTVYNIHDDYFQLKDFNELIVDAGVELLLDNGATCSFGLTTERQLYVHHFGSLSEITGEEDIWEVDLEGFNENQGYLGKKISKVEIDWNWYFDLDENFEAVETPTAIPKEVFLYFDDQKFIQIAPIMFSLEQGELSDVWYNSQARLLLNFNDKIEITEYDS